MLSCGKTGTLCNSDDAAVGNREALRIARPIETDPLARGNLDVLFDNAALQLCSLPDRDTLKEDRILYQGALSMDTGATRLLPPR